VALTVMVASFRDSVTRWLDVVLPADLYVRTAPAGGGQRHAPSSALRAGGWRNCPAWRAWARSARATCC
jgi:hypothetical protein